MYVLPYVSEFTGSGPAKFSSKKTKAPEKNNKERKNGNSTTINLRSKSLPSAINSSEDLLKRFRASRSEDNLKITRHLTGKIHKAHKYSILPILL